MANSGDFPKSGGLVDKVWAGDYNAIQSFVSNTMGTGSGDAGYGQTGASGYGTYLSSSTRTSGTKIFASDINNLKSDLDRLSQHQTGSATGLGSVTAGVTVITADTWNNYYNTAQTLYSNRLNVHSTALSLGAGVSPDLPNPWNGTRSHVVTVTFGSSDATRYFFNTGSYIQLQSSNNYGAIDTTKNGRWYRLFQQYLGVVRFGAYTTTISGNGSGVTNGNLGWYDLTTSNQTVVSYVDTSPYSNNSYSISAYKNAGNTVITFTITFNDGAPDPGQTIDENVTATTTSSVVSYYSAQYGITVPAPTISTFSGP